MLLSYTLKHNGQESHFVEKVIRGAIAEEAITPDQLWDLTQTKIEKANNKYVLDRTLIVKPKIHTFREGYRWRVGMDVHHCINAAQKTICMFYTGTVMQVLNYEVNVEHVINALYSFELKVLNHNRHILTIKAHYTRSIVKRTRKVEYKMISCDNVELLNTIAVNDGFDGMELAPELEFIKYFKASSRGQIIFFTSKKPYGV